MDNIFSLMYSNQETYLEAWSYLVKVNSPFRCNPAIREITLDVNDYELQEEFDEDCARLTLLNK